LDVKRPLSHSLSTSCSVRMTGREEIEILAGARGQGAKQVAFLRDSGTMLILRCQYELRSVLFWVISPLSSRAAVGHIDIAHSPIRLCNFLFLFFTGSEVDKKTNLLSTENLSYSTAVLVFRMTIMLRFLGHHHNVNILSYQLTWMILFKLS
jgi:hypothetical protein